MTPRGIRFGISTQAVGAVGLSDNQLYRELMADVELGDRLGYQDVWLIEHHFSDYYPTPDPLMMLSHIAATYPDMSLGTMVLVTPWHDPLRMAEQIAMLSNLTRGELHIGMGRGTAKLEYDAFGIDMSEARSRFRENYEIVDRALRGEVFNYKGAHYQMGRSVRVRPDAQRDRIQLYGAVASTDSGGIMGALGLPPISTAQFPHHIHRSNLAEWQAQMALGGKSVDAPKVIMVHTYVAETDEVADRGAREYFSKYFQCQVEHYEAVADFVKDIEGYQNHSRFFANMRKLTDPANLGPWLEFQFVGSPATVRKRVEQYVDLGFDHFIVNASTPCVPRAVRHEIHRLFANEVMPHFSAGEAAPRLVGCVNA